MKQMTILLAFCLFATLPCPAKIKVVERSAKKTPVWVNTTQTDYIITSAIASSAEEAKNECVGNVRKYIIDAVAQNIQATGESTIRQESVNDGITQFLDTYSYTSQTQSANLPYLAGISASKVEESYWEKRQDTESKEVSYLYAIKYPFPSIELKKLVHEFKKRDTEMNDRLATLERGYAEITSVEQIGKAINDLGMLEEYFFDDLRKHAARTLQRNYRQLYGQIGIREVSNKPGMCVLALTLRGKDIEAPQRPALKSETLARLRAEQAGTEWHVLYDYSTCDPAEENAATATFRIGGRTLAHRFYADVNGEKIQLHPTKEVYLTAVRRDSLLTGITVRMNLDMGQAQLLKVYAITLDVPGLDKPLFIEGQTFTLSGKGMQTLQTTFPGNAIVLEGQNGRPNLLKGHLEVLDAQNNTHRVDFSLPFKANW